MTEAEALERHEGLVRHIAKRFKGQWLTEEDLRQEGRMGLLHAVRHFKPEKGFKFATYAALCIRGYILKAIGDNRSPVRVPLTAQHNGVMPPTVYALEELVGPDGLSNWEEWFSDERGDFTQTVDDRLLVDGMFSKLSPKLRGALVAYYIKGQNYREMAEGTGKTHQAFLERVKRGKQQLREQYGDCI